MQEILLVTKSVTSRTKIPYLWMVTETFRMSSNEILGPVLAGYCCWQYPFQFNLFSRDIVKAMISICLKRQSA